MRYPAGHKDRTRQRIVQGASRAYRRKGVAGVGIADLMKVLGLTHGGFYAHFRSKDDLVAAALAEGMTETLERFTARGARSAAAFAGLYLSRAHRDRATSGCVLAALAGDVPRQGVVVRRAFTKAYLRFLERLESLVPGRAARERREQALALSARLVGAILLSRALADEALSDRLLAAARRCEGRGKIPCTQDVR
jgi:TetR/AcrR family transcriptional repressor of nem operon